MAKTLKQGSRARQAPPIRVGDRPLLQIESLVGGGESLGRVDGFAVFVPFGVPGDFLRARVISVKSGYARGLVDKLISPSPVRVAPPCPVFGRCGGCQWQALGYADQLTWKTRIVTEALQRLGGDKPVAADALGVAGDAAESAMGDGIGSIVRETLASPEPWGYRNKVHWAVDRIDGHWQIGLYGPRSHEVVDAETCLIQGDPNNRVLAAVRELLAIFDPEPFIEVSQTGWLRSIFAKTGHRTGELMLGLVTRTADFPRAAAFVAEARKRLPDLTTIVQNVHPRSGNKLLGPDTVVLFGPGTIVERLGVPGTDRHLDFSISAQSFFQVNASAVELLYQAVAEAVRPETGPRVLDAYGGTGAIALLLAAAGASEVIGIEVVPEATRDARVNAQANQLTDRATFITGDVARAIPTRPDADAEGLPPGWRPDVVVLDPPRKGCEPEALVALAGLGAPRMVYVSCNPATLARDLGILGGLGYRTSWVQPVDMFPQTAHIECVAALEREAVGSRTPGLTTGG